MDKMGVEALFGFSDKRLLLAACTWKLFSYAFLHPTYMHHLSTSVKFMIKEIWDGNSVKSM